MRLGDWQVRAATPADAAVIAGWNQRLAGETESKRLRDETLSAGVNAVLADAGKGRYFLACEDGRPIGQLLITYEWSDWRNGWIWWIQSVYVESSHRRRGVYRALRDHAARQARQQGDVVGLRLYVERENHLAQSVYEGTGMNNAGYLVYEQLWNDVDPLEERAQ